MAAPKTDSNCESFRLALDVLVRPWAALVLNLLQAGPLRFSELSAAAQGPGDKVLSQRLKELEARSLLVRRVEPGPPLRVSYELTPQGRAFNDVAAAIERWGRCLAAAPKKRPTARRAARSA
ncbi:MAG: helix-turn-helix transcriptional regulator [Labilithrix sp.]|nr:helix-turn-helix transcriptional regulator [Labilithrix sp.]MCW5837195.1 helix-turn-helix transcriptional regulator [Labilithrix sp.]